MPGNAGIGGQSKKSMRHDMKSHLATLKDYTAGNKAAADYLNRLLGDIGESQKVIYEYTNNH